MCSQWVVCVCYFARRLRSLRQGSSVGPGTLSSVVSVHVTWTTQSQWALFSALCLGWCCASGPQHRAAENELIEKIGRAHV
mmetsp:Transcript_90581/g.242611  ORF Transcript_90581/g.242611 Transcript_90581/m.242611 type:complete len:81 (+) Transcript_90581:1311-1553(+)